MHFKAKFVGAFRQERRAVQSRRCQVARGGRRIYLDQRAAVLVDRCPKAIAGIEAEDRL